MAHGLGAATSDGICRPRRQSGSFERRCLLRERERIAGNAYSFGVFVDSVFCGEVNLNGVARGSMQSATIGYWIDQAKPDTPTLPKPLQ